MAERALQATDGNLTEAAARLGMHRITLHKMLRKGKAVGEVPSP
ncbi:MAG: helix-turn-helix domain-containing protein [Pyrinomonadaceae bacterium]